jgi:DNA-binding NtrC family response regulator
MERLVVLNQSGLILEQEVRPCLRGRETGAASPSGAVALGRSVADAEKSAIEGALEASGGNRTQAAKALGISRRTLHNKLREHSIE